MNSIYSRVFRGSSGLTNFVVLAVLLLVLLPVTLPIFRLNLVAKYLTYAFVALGLVTLWGKAGVLSLGQGVFFGLGGYCMAMFLKLEASDPISTKIQSTPGIPDFMDWNQLKALPAFWVPFKHLSFSLFAVFAIPMLVAFVVGLAMFKRRVGGVYFAIITQALALILSLGIDSRQGYTGGRNGITDLRTLCGWDIRAPHSQYILYFVTCALLLLCILVSQWLLSGKVGKMLLALRDRENRVRFSGYDVSMFKVAAFCFAAALSGLGGALFVLQVGFISPSLVGIVPSIEMVIFAAVGGRASLYGAVYGTLLVNTGKSLFSETFPQLWLFAMGGLFIAVVVLFPDGLAGVFELLRKKAGPAWERLRTGRSLSIVETMAKGEKP
jgi:urea transport system permease protein